ncbi:MAG TPA: Mth938-like domain-containing protein [Burkholderiales bacterium]|nr:Mth938-like domain-containing protein [Burkholderiales bacterium]
MKLHLASIDQKNAFTGYGQGYVMVNARRYERSLVVLPGQLIENWGVADVDALAGDHISFLAGLNLEILLLGTGGELRFPSPRLLQPLALAGIGVEVMDTRAACRTYNVLLAEGRNVAAALIL